MPDGWFRYIKQDNKIHLSNVQPFLPNTCSHQSVVPTWPESTDHLHKDKYRQQDPLSEVFF